MKIVQDAWETVLREAEASGEMPVLNAWEAEAICAFLAESGHSFDDIEEPGVAEEYRNFERRLRRRHWWRWLVLRRKTIRGSEIADRT